MNLLSNNIILNAVEHNWGRHGPGDWDTVEWVIYYNHTYETKVDFVAKYDWKTNKTINVPQIINTGKIDDKTFSDLEALLKTKAWRDPNIDIQASDGVAWKIDYYSSEGKIINSSGKLGYIYGEKLLGDIVKMLAELQKPYGAPAYVYVKQKGYISNSDNPENR
jgi:hypothetical protein